MIKNLGDLFLLALLVCALYFSYLILKPFLFVIIMSMVLVSITYPIYKWFLKKLKGRKNIVSLLMCLIISAVLIVPLVNFLIFLSKQSVDAYNFLNLKFHNGEVKSIIDRLGFFTKYIPADIDITSYLLEIGGKINNFVISGAATIIKGTTNFFTTLFLVILTMFFFYRDGEAILQRVMHLTPLSNKYDMAIFKKFHEVSHSAIVATFITAIAQGIVGAIGFMIIGVPALFLGIGMAFASLIPFVGTVIVWLPAAIVLMIMGKIGSGIFILIWGAVAVGLVDNVLRPILMKGRAKIHPLFIFFSILGGISVFGFWGVVFGPLVIAIALTLIYIYEMEYGRALEK